MTYEAIGAELGVDRSAAYKAVRRVLRRLADEADADGREWRALELERLEAALVSIAKEVKGGNLAAVDRWVRIIEAECRLLGLFESTGPSTVVNVGAEWVEVRAVVLDALAPYPDVRAVVASRLLGEPAVEPVGGADG